MSVDPNQDKETTHSATDEDKCYEMEARYGWDLNKVVETKSEILSVDCIFDGDAEFPKSRMDYTSSDYLEEINEADDD